MIEVGTLSPAVQAGVLIGAVLFEAMILYVGYGFVEQVVGNRLIERIENN
ncbi:hypothetical protein SAMN05216559_3688 [Halomicrobium zhouii]|uniref:Uncharacterized protein n=1 Tax=Halomicrobium zhouii TaxID=767519 RepID=A0A1I6M3H4_9EURY|nr:hypothetical protein [Halomicrobium zhouii]SFS10240.1 hypothetical protein SAMN05216559_3688 [Halomicrobium zhouii]